MIYAALNPVSQETQQQVNLFNNRHKDIQIEILDYSDEGGLDRLRTELVLGKVPDIMEMHYFGKAGPQVAATAGDAYNVLPGSYSEAADEYWMPYRQMAQKGYLEDLWPYIEADPDFGSDGVLQAPIAAAKVDDSLYILFQNVVVFTLTGRESIVGDRYSWTMEDVMEVLDGMPEGSTILRYNMTKRDAFFNLLRFSLDRFVDWSGGECYFDSQSFLDFVHFLETLPDEVDSEDPLETEYEIIRRIRIGEQMLEAKMITWQTSIGFSDAIWQERAAFPGYPTADGSSGSFFYPPGTILAMSSTCRNKDAAWDYIRRLILPRLTTKRPTATYLNIPVNFHDFEVLLWGEIKQLYDGQMILGWDLDKYLREGPYTTNRHFEYSRPLCLEHLLTEEDTQRYRDLIDHTTQLYWPNDDLSNIVWETLGPYFAGDWTLDHTIEMVQNRVQLYVDEQR